MRLFTSGGSTKLARTPLQNFAIDRKNAHRKLVGWLMVISLLFVFSRVVAQSLRDPTLPPPVAKLANVRSAETPLGIESGSITIIVRNGLPYLVIGTRLYAQGETIGPVRIDLITETEIWLREGGVLRKVSQFPGIQRHSEWPLAATAVCAPVPSKPSSSAAPCVKVQP